MAFDVGNTALKCAIGREGGWEVVFRMPTRPVDTLAARLCEALGAAGEAIPQGERRWVVSSVCPEADAALAEDCRRRGVPGPRVFGRGLPIPIPVLVRQPERVGTDRLLSALGAREMLGAPCIAVGAGTAITIDLVDADGRFAGGAIAPGFELAARILHQATACLPLVEPSRPSRPVGLDTEEAIRIGVDAFCRGGVAALVAGMRRQLGERGVRLRGVVVSGGAASRLLPLELHAGGAPPEARHVPDLIFRGMAAALQRQD